LIGLNFDLQHRAPALDAIAAAQVRFRNFLAVYKSTVGRSQVTEKDSRRGNLQQAMMTREELVFGKIKVRRIGAANQERVMLIEGELAAGVRSL
jgi:hypothetical protein